MSKTVIRYGARFQEDVESSCVHSDLFFFRVRDVFIPAQFRKSIPVPQNKYDCLVYNFPTLLALELKTTKSKSISFSESIIKQTQIDNLEKDATYKGVIAGFLFNFREDDNETYFVHINDFLAYKHVAENGIKDHNYKSRVNRASIPIGICREIGVPVSNHKLKVRYRYDFNDLFDKLKERNY